MNIFLTSYNPEIAASHLDDKRLNKMILETGQLLSQSYRYNFRDSSLLYKDTHINHPCSVWARYNKNNFIWLTEYFYRLAQERLYRTGKSHASYDKLYKIFQYAVLNKCTFIDVFDSSTYDRKVEGYINFTFNCTDYKDKDDIRESYKKQLIDKWNNDKVTPKWTKRGKPSFYDVNPIK